MGFGIFFVVSHRANEKKVDMVLIFGIKSTATLTRAKTPPRSNDGETFISGPAAMPQWSTRSVLVRGRKALNQAH